MISKNNGRLFITAALLFLLWVHPALALANSGSFPATPINGMQITYSIGGATAGSPSDQSGNPTSRTLKGPLGTGYLQAVGTIKTNAASTDVLVVVTIGDQTKDFKLSLKGTATQSYNVAIPIPAGATSGTISINMTGRWQSENQETSQTIVVNGLFGDAPPPPPAPPSTPPTQKPPDKAPETPPTTPQPNPPKQPPDKSPRWWPPDWPDPFSKTPSTPSPDNHTPPASQTPQTKPSDPASTKQEPPAPVPKPAEPYEPIPTAAIVFFVLVSIGLVVGTAILQRSRQRKPTPISAANQNPSQIPIITLQGVAGPYDGQTFVLQAPVVFGRDPSVSNIPFPIQDIRISRKHAVISYDTTSQAFLLQDYSRNGTFLLVEGDLNRIGTCRLQPGDYFCLVDSGICFTYLRSSATPS